MAVWGCRLFPAGPGLFPFGKKDMLLLYQKNKFLSFAMMTGFSTATHPIQGFLSRKDSPWGVVATPAPHRSSWYFEFKPSLPHLHKDVGAHQANETAHLSTAGALDFNLVLCEVPGAISKAHQSRVFRNTACAWCGCGLACIKLESWRGGLGCSS